MAYYLDAARRFLFLHASLRGESDARRGFRREAMRHGLSGTLCDTVQDAVEKALRRLVRTT